MTDKFSATKMPHNIGINNSLRNNIAKTAMIPPMVKLPVSPINTLAGNELCHKNPIQAPRKQAEKTTSSAELGM